MKKSLSKEFMLEEGFAEMEAEKASISVENWYLEDCVTTVLNEIEDWKRNNWFFMEPEIGPWFYELETYDQTLLLVEAVNCLAKSENPAWYGAKDMIVNVLLNGKTSTDLPPDAIVWMEESWGMPALEMYSRVVGTISVHLPGWSSNDIGKSLDNRTRPGKSLVRI